MKKSLLLVLVLLALTLLLCACDKNKGENKSSGEKGSNNSSDVETQEMVNNTIQEMFYEKLVDTLGIGRPISKEQVIELYDLDKDFNNMVYCIINKQEDSYDEVFITEGAEDNKDLLIKLASRVEAIRRNPENADIKEKIADSKNVTIKEFRGYVILVVSNRSSELVDKLDKYILDNEDR